MTKEKSYLQIVDHAFVDIHRREILNTLPPLLHPKYMLVKSYSISYQRKLQMSYILQICKQICNLFNNELLLHGEKMYRDPLVQNETYKF